VRAGRDGSTWKREEEKEREKERERRSSKRSVYGKKEKSPDRYVELSYDACECTRGRVDGKGA